MKLANISVRRSVVVSYRHLISFKSSNSPIQIVDIQLLSVSYLQTNFVSHFQIGIEYRMLTVESHKGDLTTTVALTKVAALISSLSVTCYSTSFAALRQDGAYLYAALAPSLHLLQ